MHQTIILSALSAFVAKSLAQVTAVTLGADFVNMTWNAVQVGQEWPINWSVGNGGAITLAFGNSTWNEIIASKQQSTCHLESVLTIGKVPSQPRPVHTTGLSQCQPASSPATTSSLCHKSALAPPTHRSSALHSATSFLLLQMSPPAHPQ